MDESNDKKTIVTVQEVQKIIDGTLWGEYDEYHEWSPSYTADDKVNFLETLLKNWEITEQEGKKLIVQFIRTIRKESGGHNFVIANKLAQYAQLPEIVDVTNEFLHSGFFCYNLLVSMKNNNVRQEDWLIKIRKVLAESSFLERKKDLRRENLYQLIEQLILELS